MNYRKFMFLLSLLVMVGSLTMMLWVFLAILTSSQDNEVYNYLIPALGFSSIISISLIALAIKRLGWNGMVDHQILVIEDVIDQLVGEVEAFEAAAPTLAGGIIGFVLGGGVPGAIIGAIIATPSELEQKTE